MNEVIESLNIGKWINTKVKHLSHGSRKRADIARTLIHKPKLLTLDEPFSGLDPQARKLVIENISDREHNLDRAVLLSLQDLELAREFCDRAVILQDGRIVKESSFR